MDKALVQYRLIKLFLKNKIYIFSFLLETYEFEIPTLNNLLF